MRYLHILAIVMTQFSIGTLLMTSFVSPRSLPAPFFLVNSLLSAVAAGIALVCVKISLPDGWWDVRFLGLAVIGATIAYGCYRLERRDIGRFALIVTGIAALVLGLLPLADRTLELWGVVTRVPYVFAASTMVGSLLIGSAYVAMFLSPWHSLVRGEFYEHLNRIVKIFMGVLLVRFLLLMATLFLLSRIDANLAASFLPTLWADNVMVFGLRVGLGLVAPMFLVWKAYVAMEENPDPPPFRQLAAITISVLLGEACAAYVLI